MRKSITRKTRGSTNTTAAPANKPSNLPVITMAAAPNKVLQSEQAVYSAFQALDWLQFPDVDEVLVKGGLSRANLRTLEADDEVAQCIETRRDALISTPWRLEPQQSRASQWLAEQLAPVMDSLLRGSFNAVLYGYSVIEVVYQPLPGGRIGIHHLSEKPLEWFEPRHDGKLIYRSDAGGQVEVDRRKFLVTVRNGSYRQPYGESLLSRVYWTTFFKSHGRKFWARFLERFGEPLIIGKVADQAKFIDDVRRLGLQASLPVQPGDEISHVALTQAGEFERFENTLTRSIQKLILGQTLTSDVGSSGSFAAAKVHDSVRQDKRNADIRLVSGTVQQLINILWSLNAFSGSAPVFTMADDTGLEAARAARDALLVEKGVITLTEEYLLDRYDYRPGDFTIPAPAEKEALQKSTPDAAGDDDDEKAEKTDAQLSAQATLATAGKPQFTPGQQAIEDRIDALLAGDMPQPIDPIALQGAILAATDADDLMQRLAIVLQDASPQAFAQTVERALFAAEIMGYAHASAHGSAPAIKDPPTPDPLASLAAQLLQKELAA